MIGLGDVVFPCAPGDGLFCCLVLRAGRWHALFVGALVLDAVF